MLVTDIESASSVNKVSIKLRGSARDLLQAQTHDQLAIPEKSEENVNSDDSLSGRSVTPKLDLQLIDVKRFDSVSDPRSSIDKDGSNSP